tara:strand:- start:528 stop:842 length:315 start_codon:yes stop_codon:yes gene_type:complete
MARTFGNEIEELGHPGKWQRVIAVGTNTTTNFTGSMYGAGAIMLETNACGDGVTGTVIHLSGGGTILGDKLVANTMYEFSIKKVVIPSVTGASGSVFIRNFNIR